MQIFVDADACPVVDIVETIAEKYNIPVTLLCDTNHVLYSDYSEVFVVGAGADAVDYKLISICHRGDIVVSQDYGVAAMALGKGAYAIHQSDRWYTDENIDRMLMERHLNKKARQKSFRNHIKGPRKRTSEDDERFTQSFERLVQMAQAREGKENFTSHYEWRDRNRYYGKKFSILGDSISTLKGYNPQGYKVFYDTDNCKRANIEAYTDTWWGQVLEFFDAELLVNNSWSGSRVTKFPDQEQLFPAGCSDERTSSLHSMFATPDVLLVNLGTNDWAFGVKTGKEAHDQNKAWSELFKDAYRAMLQKVKYNYPECEVWCCTLGTTFISGNPQFRFPYQYAGLHIEEYNEIIRRIVREEKCKLIDLYHMNTRYDSIDGTHPNINGMKTIASAVCYGMADAAGRYFLQLRKNGNGERKNDLPDENNCASAEEYVFINQGITTVLYDEIISLTNEATGEEIQIRAVQFDCGRSNDCMLKLVNTAISRNHASFFYEKNSWFIRDNHSTNGTWINGIRMEPGKKYQLSADDVIGFAGTYQYIFYKTIHCN